MYGYAYVLELKLTYFNPRFLENYIIQKKCLGIWETTYKFCLDN